MHNGTVPFVILALLAGNAAVGQGSHRSVPSDSLLGAISRRGRLLAAYDAAAWHGTDAVVALSPKKGSFYTYLAYQASDGWVVSFGRLTASRDTFLIAYQATQTGAVDSFSAMAFNPPRATVGFERDAAVAIAVVPVDSLKLTRTYNVAILPAEAARQFWIYLTPAPTRAGITPLGGDWRFLVAADSARVLEKRQLHRAVLEYALPDSAVSGMHTAIVDDVPEDTDVFYVLTRRPLRQEYVVSEHYFYQVRTDGTITWRRR